MHSSPDTVHCMRDGVLCFIFCASLYPLLMLLNITAFLLISSISLVNFFLHWPVPYLIWTYTDIAILSTLPCFRAHWTLLGCPYMVGWSPFAIWIYIHVHSTYETMTIIIIRSYDRLHQFNNRCESDDIFLWKCSY